MKKEVHIVKNQPDYDLIRLSDYAVGLFSTLQTKSSVKKAIKKGLILIDGTEAGTGNIIKKGQIIEFIKDENRELKIYELKVDVIYEDEFIAIINKPAGLSISGNSFKTLYNALPYNLKVSQENDALLLPTPVHRIDKQTTGIVIVAKTKTAQVRLGEMFEKRLVKKQYKAIVKGKLKGEGVIRSNIEGVDSISGYFSKKIFKRKNGAHYTLVDLYPKTGRTHQLRIHCSHKGHPIVGDRLYDLSGKVVKGKGLFLCACGIEFNHPITNEPFNIKIELPKKFNQFLQVSQ